MFAAIERGKPALVMLDMTGRGTERVVSLPQFGQILTPAWSPNGRAIAFTALEGGLTDLYVYEIASGALRAITNDAYSDLHPEWSPDGARLAFTTDRFSTDLTGLRFGHTALALADVATASVERVAAIDDASHFNPQWSADGTSLYFFSDPGGISNVYRIDLASRDVHQVTETQGGVGGLTPTSPALSVARSAPVLAFTHYRRGRYDIEIRRGAEALAGVAPAGSTAATAAALPPIERTDSVVAEVLADDVTGLPEAARIQSKPYVPRFFLEAVGTPYISAGGSPFGTYVRAGGSFLFSDLLGERKVAVFAQAGNQLRDLALHVQFLNRERRWNWGAVAEVEPSLRRLPRIWSNDVDAAPAFTSETHYFERTQARLTGVLLYPLDRAQRIEFEAGGRYSAYRRTVNSVVRSMTNGRILSRETTDGDAGAPTRAGEASAAYVRDTTVFGPTGPILGDRSRVEVAATFGDLSATRLLVDHRRYLMPVKPYTVAMRLLHLGQYRSRRGRRSGAAVVHRLPLVPPRVWMGIDPVPGECGGRVRRIRRAAREPARRHESRAARAAARPAAARSPLRSRSGRGVRLRGRRPRLVARARVLGGQRGASPDQELRHRRARERARHAARMGRDSRDRSTGARMVVRPQLPSRLLDADYADRADLIGCSVRL